MAILTGSILIDFVLALLTLSYLLYWYITNNDDYWQKRGVPHVKKGLLFQSIVGKKSQNEAVQEIYDTFKGERFGGYFHVKRPVLMVRDPDLINRIMVKDFTSFQDRGFHQSKNDPITNSLFSMNGQNWRTMRYKLTPTFSAGKLKGMFEQLSECGDNMLKRIEELTHSKTEIECKEFLSEFTLDVIASVGFGLEFERNSREFNEFKSTVHKIHKSQSPFRFVKLMLMELFPKLKFIISEKPFSSEVGDYFVNLTKSTLKYRKENNVQRKDYFQLLMTLKELEESGKDLGLPTDPNEDDTVVNQMQFSEKDKSSSTSKTKLFTEEALCANTFVFLSAGTESTSSIISLVLYALAQYEEVQQRLQAEVDAVLRNQGGWSYQAVKDMTYMDQIIQETQRLYPNFTHLQRMCVQDYKVPDSDLVIEKGVIISIPHYSMQRDPQYYPDPEQFKPERFEENNFKPNSTFMPFGDGPRICIAMRFAVMEVKTCVARIMSQYSVRLSPKTKLPLRMAPRTVVPVVEGGLWLTYEKRDLP